MTPHKPWYFAVIAFLFCFLLHVLYGLRINEVYEKIKAVEQKNEELKEKLYKIKVICLENSCEFGE